jgi:hypothetical protein
MDPLAQFCHNPDCPVRMYLVGCADNFCWEHDSLRVATQPGERLKWRVRTPAMAAGLADHRWTVHELLSYPIPLPPWVAPKAPGAPAETMSGTRGSSSMITVHGSLRCYLSR